MEHAYGFSKCRFLNLSIFNYFLFINSIHFQSDDFLAFFRELLEGIRNKSRQLKKNAPLIRNPT